MNRLFDQLVNEWEKTACWMTAAIMATFVLTWLSPGDDGGTTSSGRPLRRRTPLLNRHAFRFMDRMPNSTLKGANPLCFRYVPPADFSSQGQPSEVSLRGPAHRPETAPHKPAAGTEEPPHRPETAPHTPAEAAEAPHGHAGPAGLPPSATDRTKPPTAGAETVTTSPPNGTPSQKREIVLCGVMRTLSGRTVAQVEVHDLATNKKVLDFCTPGAQVQGVTIESITDGAIEVSDPTGQTRTISIGSTNRKTITFE
ncbi:MAG: hypothetical protein HN742_37040 [Lentisphaerae bacterium]|jgi:hypothetical protein|nr:hypothetical protein [Lentisphaerota bacterium]MBT4818091.1 hypothetical protein [Lentisphaerota bacterium]MBT5611916.1 hypothetical protein [Lentisphaerota bacterium]MBT7055487.1 hypothetical protein [Lentisphaerota bacterium]MBT7847533.1 hypothetical protein [Lentisphaerota bacterium]